MTKYTQLDTQDILYEDNHLLVVKKQPNVPVQRDSSEDMDLLSMAKEYIQQKYDKPGAVYLGLVHRLDRPVGGVMVFARTSKAATRLSQDIQKCIWKKQYYAVVEGKPKQQEILTDWLIKDEKTFSSHVVGEQTKGAKFAELSYEMLQQTNNLSLLDVTLQTGRHHQIRVQLASRGYPIWGDARYNPRSQAGEQIALWAHQLQIVHPTKKEIMTFSALPDSNAEPWYEFDMFL